MGKLSKEEAARFGGAAWALKICEEQGIEACREEFERRNILQIPLNVTKAQLREFQDRIKQNCLNTICMMSVYVALDEFDLDREQLARFIERFNKRSECLDGDFISWEEIQKTLMEEINLKLPLTEEILMLRKEKE